MSKKKKATAEELLQAQVGLALLRSAVEAARTDKVLPKKLRKQLKATLPLIDDADRSTTKQHRKRSAERAADARRERGVARPASEAPAHRSARGGRAGRRARKRARR